MDVRNMTIEQTEKVCKTEAYKKLTKRLHRKYPICVLTGDYPPQYWTEFNEEFNRIAEGIDG